MKINSRSFGIFILSLFSLVSWLLAQNPQLLNYQGKLTNPKGTPANGTYTITFRIYPDTTASNNLWEEKHENVKVMNGIFNVLLGSSTPFRDLFTQAGDRYLGLTLAGDLELKPRFRLTSVAYAIHANSASGLSAADGDPVSAVVVDNNGNVGIGPAGMKLGGKFTVATQTDHDGLWVFGNNKRIALLTNLKPGGYNPLSQDGDQMLHWGGSDYGKPGGLVIAPWRSNASGIRIDPYGNVGIGIATPASALHVKGQILMEGCDFVMRDPSRGNGGRALVHGGSGSGTDDNLMINYAGDFEAGVHIYGPKTVVYGAFVNPSDIRLKTNIKPINNCLEKLEKINGISFEWSDTYKLLAGLTEKREIGVSAQEVEKVFPELVTSSGLEDYKAVDYSKMAAIFIEAIKELKTENDQLKQELAELKNLIQK